MNRPFGVLVASCFLLPVSAAAQTPLQLAPFNSIEVMNGAHAIVRYGPTQRVTLVNGSLEYSRVVVSNGTLLIDKCVDKCPRGYRIEVDITVPSLNRISLAHSGNIQSRGSFPRQDELIVDVAHGGQIDVRSMPARTVTASVEQGGGIQTTPEALLVAKITQGGAITYWGDAQVKSSVEHGGVVQKGSR